MSNGDIVEQFINNNDIIFADANVEESIVDEKIWNKSGVEKEPPLHLHVPSQDPSVSGRHGVGRSTKRSGEDVQMSKSTKKMEGSAHKDYGHDLNNRQGPNDIILGTKNDSIFRRLYFKTIEKKLPELITNFPDELKKIVMRVKESNNTTLMANRMKLNFTVNKAFTAKIKNLGQGKAANMQIAGTKHIAKNDPNGNGKSAEGTKAPVRNPRDLLKEENSVK